MSTLSSDAVTTVELDPVTYEPLLDQVEIAVLAPGADPQWSLTEGSDGLSVLHVEATGEPVEIRLSVPLGDAAGYWHPQAEWRRTLLADWKGRARVGLVDGLATGCLYDHTGATKLAFSAADPVPEVQLRFGVSEENDTHVVHLELPASPGPHRILFVPRSDSVATAMRALRGWYAAATPAMPVPESARLPVYSTWCAFNQQVDAGTVEAQARLAARFGCGCSSSTTAGSAWAAGAVTPAAATGCRTRTSSPTSRAMSPGSRPPGCGTWRGSRRCSWARPRAATHSGPRPLRHLPGHPARTYSTPGGRKCAATSSRRVALVRDHGLEGLTVDFIDEAMVYAGDGGDIGHALTALLTDLRTALETVRPELLLELRQPYVGPGMAAYGNMLRSFDCPAYATANRVRTIDTSLLAVSGTVHSDMLLWDPSAPLEAAVRQFSGAFHSVPQLSVRLDRLPPEQLDALGFWLGQWRRLRPQLLDGRRAGPPRRPLLPGRVIRGRRERGERAQRARRMPTAYSVRGISAGQRIRRGSSRRGRTESRSRRGHRCPRPGRSYDRPWTDRSLTRSAQPAGATDGTGRCPEKFVSRPTKGSA
ncbi:alpha-galactosidase [Streptomyces sp. NPDC020800]|uniref:alpha-galactosidase n=1 Tax=Streptomyces sp. NPDC020800 TaxID=3365092 RepID=UPI003797AA66